jgi:precorrin-2 dehydrogenase/sirohydrochlorin ferrochelatase
LNPYYPVFLDLSKKNVLVIGGGEVALRKILTLMKHGADITVIAKTAHPKTAFLARQKKIKLEKRAFENADLKNTDLVICATNDPALNQQVGGQCRKKKIWVNVVDHPALCSFIVPSIVQEGNVTLAISTGGASPALAKFLRKQIEPLLGKEIGLLAETLKKFREPLKQLPIEKRKKVLNHILKDGVLQRIKRHGIRFVVKDLKQIKSKALDQSSSYKIITKK